MQNILTLNFKSRKAFQLTTTKDCKCEIHEGPHYQFIDELWREQNLEALKRANAAQQTGDIKTATLMIQEFARQEIARVRAKQRGVEAYRWWLLTNNRREAAELARDF